jgi:hypothetical protein
VRRRGSLLAELGRPARGALSRVDGRQIRRPFNYFFSEHWSDCPVVLGDICNWASRRRVLAPTREAGVRAGRLAQCRAATCPARTPVPGVRLANSTAAPVTNDGSVGPAHTVDGASTATHKGQAGDCCLAREKR